MAGKTLLCYQDLASMPTDRLRRELVGGELVVSPSPATRHQVVVGELFAALREYAIARGGVAFVAPLDVVLTQHDVVEPDVFYVGAEQLDIVGERAIEGAPRFVIEVLSPSSRGVDAEGGAKYRLYARHGVCEYWVVDPDARTIDAYTAPHPVAQRYRERKNAVGRMGATALPGFEAAL